MRKLKPSRRSLIGASAVLVLAGPFGGIAMAAETDDINLKALARLRPGAPASALQAALGRHWRAPAPHKGGLVDIVENSHGFIARLDIDGIVREVIYSWRFDGRPFIDGLRIGMTLDEVKAAQPDIRIDKPPAGGPPRTGVVGLSDTLRLHLYFSNDSLRAIWFLTIDAVYPPEGPPPYPAMAGEPGAPFKDPNLKLLALSDLRDRKVIDLGTPQQLAEHVLKRKVDLDDEGYDLIPEAYEYLARYPLTPDLLAQVKRLYFDASTGIVEYAWLFWTGESGAFDVHSLEGIEHCINLERIGIITLFSPGEIDLRQLAALPRMRKIDVNVDLRHLEVLLGMRELKELHLRSKETYNDVMTPGHPTRTIMEALKARGVDVWIAGSSNDPLYR